MFRQKDIKTVGPENHRTREEDFGQKDGSDESDFSDRSDFSDKSGGRGKINNRVDGRLSLSKIA